MKIPTEQECYSLMNKHKMLPNIIVHSKVVMNVSVAIVDSEVVDLAISSNFSDLEDAIQYYSAVRNGINLIITRNKKDYLKAKLLVATPEESLVILQKSK